MPRTPIAATVIPGSCSRGAVAVRAALPMERPLDPARIGDHLDRLYRAAWALCGSREDAEDLVQETYARVLGRPRLLRKDDDLGYLLRALRNTFLNQSGPRAAGSVPTRCPTSSTSSPTRRRASRRRRSRPPSSTRRSPRCPATSATSSSLSTSPASRTRRRHAPCGSARDGDEPPLPRPPAGRAPSRRRPAPSLRQPPVSTVPTSTFSPDEA